ncbi:MAG: hypothetical protein ACI4N0_05800 [Christensenellales bacterium]
MNKQDMSKVKAFKEKIGYDDPVTKEDLINALESAIRDRGFFLYFTWKAIQKLHPEIDADEVIMEATHNYGLFKSKSVGNVTNACEGMLNQSSKNGMLVFNQEFVALRDDYAEKHIHNCPLVNAFRQVGATPEEVSKMCKKLLYPGDYGILEPFKDKMEVTFPKTLSDDDVCIMCVKNKN